MVTTLFNFFFSNDEYFAVSFFQQELKSQISKSRVRFPVMYDTSVEATTEEENCVIYGLKTCFKMIYWYPSQNKRVYPRVQKAKEQVP